MNRLPIKLLLVITLVLFCSSVPAAGAALNGNTTGNPEKIELTAAQWLDKGKAYSNNNDYASAISAYDQAIQLSQQWDQPFAERGKAFLLTRQFDLALADFTKASELNPSNGDYVWLNGLAYAGKGQHQLAIDQYKKTLKIDPKMYMAYWNLALSYERIGMPELAVEAYTKLTQIAPPDYPNFDKAKKRLEELSAVSRIEDFSGAINKTIDASQIKSIVLDYQDTDYLTLNFEKPRWKIGYQQIGKNVIVEFVTGNETVQKWSELITVQFFGDLKNITPQQYVAITEKRNRSIFGDKMTFYVLHISDADAIIEYRVSGHANIPDEHTITRVFKGKGSLGFVHYAAKPSMTKDQRAVGLNILQGVQYSDHLPQ